MTAPAYVNASSGATDAQGNWSATGASTSGAGSLVILQILQDGATVSAVALTGATNIENLAGTDNAWTKITGPNADGSFNVGGTPSALQHLWIGRSLSSSAPTASGTNSTSEDLYWRFYEFSGVSTGTTLSTVIENSTAGSAANGTGDSNTASDTGVTTIGGDRLAVNFLAVNDDNSIAQFSGQTGGTWVEVGEYADSGGTDGAIQLQYAEMLAPGTINGGTCSITDSDAWGVVGFALIPASVTRPGTGALTLQKPSVSGTGSHTATYTGTGALTTKPPTVSGTGAMHPAGVGALTTKPPSVAGVGAHTPTHTGTGALTTFAPTISGSGEEVFTATGALATPVPSVSGTGEQILTAVGALTIQPVSVAGVGTMSTSASTGVARLRLAAGYEPDERIDHAIVVRARVTSGTGTLYAALYEGTDNRSGNLSQALTTSLAEYVLDIADLDAANITSYSALELRIWGEGDAGTVFEVDQAWLSIPPGPIPQHTGTGALTLQPPSIAGAGEETLTGTGALTTQPPQVAGVGQEILTGTGSLTTRVPQVAGTGVETIAGAGSLAVQPPTVAGTGLETLTGQGALTTQLPAVSGTGQEVFTGTGSLTTQPPSIAGAGEHTLGHTGTGALTLQTPRVAGTGSLGIEGPGALTLQVPRVAGEGTHRANPTGTGSLALMLPVVAGTGAEVLTGTGSLTTQPPTVAGSGGHFTGIAGDGALTLQVPQVSGTGTHRPNPSGVGALTLTVPTLDGTGQVVITGTGALTLAPLGVEGVGVHPVPVTGTGALTLQPTQVTGRALHAAPRTEDIGGIYPKIKPFPEPWPAPRVYISGRGALRLPTPTVMGVADNLENEDWLLLI